MAGRRFIQVVKPDDLIMIYLANANDDNVATMFVVLSAPDDNDPHPLNSSITVQQTSWDIPARPGNWILDGPQVRYITETLEWWGRDDYDPQEHPHPWHFDDPELRYPPVSLEDILDAYLPAVAPDVDQKCTQVLVNPHGRDVLKYYFKGRCPICDNEGSICPGCGGFSTSYPQIFGSCGLDQACPMCLGHDHALRDKAFLRALDKPSFQLLRHEDALLRKKTRPSQAKEDPVIPQNYHERDILPGSKVGALKRSIIDCAY